MVDNEQCERIKTILEQEDVVFNIKWENYFAQTNSYARIPSHTAP